jgi:hypothetical protein
MHRNPIATALLAGLALSAVPAFAAQERRPPEARERRGGGGGREASGAGREQRGRDGGQDRGGRTAERRGEPRAQAQVERRDNRNDARSDNRDRGQAIQRWPDRDRDWNRGDNRGRDRDRGRDYATVRPGPRWNDNDRRRVDVRPRVVRPTVVVPRYRDSYRSYPRRTYVVPYGYRPYGYRNGWNVDLYFGRPYGAGVYGSPAYGYYSLQPGFAYGSLRIVDAPRDAQVFVDGYYAGVVDDYDGIFQHLNLEPGPHHVEIELDPDAPLIEFDVQIVPGRQVTYRAVLPY